MMPRVPYLKAFMGLLLLCAIYILSSFVISFGSSYGSFERLSLGSRSLLQDVVVSINSNNYSERHITNSSNTSSFSSNSSNGLPTIYMITPTYRRAEQIPELTRTCQTLLLVKNLVWIVVEDAPKTSQEVVDYLHRCRIPFVYMRAQMPDKFSKVKNKPRGVANRNAGMEYVRKNAKEGVVYFGDDDNTYDVKIFEEIRWTRGVSMFPVGLVTSYGLSTPIVRNGKVIGFYDGWIAKRLFPVDMAGFAINVNLLKKYPTCQMPFIVGYEEDGLLKCLGTTLSAIEPKAANCSQILVWHTQTKKNKAVKYDNVKMNLENTNLADLKKHLWKGS